MKSAVRLSSPISTSRGSRVTGRDLTLLRMLAKYRYLTVSQVQQSFFPSEQTVRRRLRLLDRYDLVTVFRVHGYPERLVGLGKAGPELLGKMRRSISSPPTDHYFIRHMVGLNAFWMGLEKTCSDTTGLDLLGFISDSAGERTRDGLVRRQLRQDLEVEGVRMGHTPDGVFALKQSQSAALFFLEIDRGTEVIGRVDRGVGKICQFYLAFLLSGAYTKNQERFGVSRPFRGFRALLVTTSGRRIQNIREMARGLSPGEPQAKRFIWLSTEAQVQKEGPLEPIWTSLDSDDETLYSIAPKQGEHDGNHAEGRDHS